QKCIVELTSERLVESAHDCSEGGLAVTVAECCFGRGIGAEIALEAEAGFPAEFTLFGEDASRIVISCDPAILGRIQQSAVKYGVTALPIGTTSLDSLTIRINGTTVVSAAISKFQDAWEHALERGLHVETEERLVPGALQKS